MPAPRHQLLLLLPLLLPLLLLLLPSRTSTDALTRPLTSSRPVSDRVSPAVTVHAAMGGGGGGDGGDGGSSGPNTALTPAGRRPPTVASADDDDDEDDDVVEEAAPDKTARHLVAPRGRRAATPNDHKSDPSSTSPHLAMDATLDVVARGGAGGTRRDPGKDGREVAARPAALWRPTVPQLRTARSANWREPGMDYHSSFWLPEPPDTTTATTATTTTTTTTGSTTTVTTAKTTASTTTLGHRGSTPPPPPPRWPDSHQVHGVTAGSPPSEQRSSGPHGPDRNSTDTVPEGSAAPGRGRAASAHPAGAGNPSSQPHLHESPSTALGRRGPPTLDERPHDGAAQPSAGGGAAADPGSRRRTPPRHRVLGAAWAAHVYGCGALFLLLALASAAVAAAAGVARPAGTDAAKIAAAAGGPEEPAGRASPLFASKSAALTSALAGGWLLCAAGAARALLLLLAGAYNADGRLGAGAARLLYDVPFPCLTAAHAATLASLAKAAEPRLPPGRECRLLAALAAAVALHFLLSLGGSLAAGLAGPGSPVSVAAPSVALVYFCAFGTALLALTVVGACGGAAAGAASPTSAEKGCLVFPSSSAQTAATPSPSPRLKAAVAAGALVAACGAAQASGVALGFVGDFEAESPAGRAPAWWTFHFCARVLELAACLALCAGAAAAVPFGRRGSQRKARTEADVEEQQQQRRWQQPNQPGVVGLTVPLARCDEVLETGKADLDCWGKLSRFLCGLGAGDGTAGVVAGAAGGGRREPQPGASTGRRDVGRPRGTPDGLESSVAAPFPSFCTDDGTARDGSGKGTKRSGDSDPGVEDSDDSSYDEDDDAVCDGSRRGKTTGGRRRRRRHKKSGSGRSLDSSLLLLHPFTMSDLDLRPPSPIELWRSIDDALLERAVITESLFRRSHSAGNLSTMGDAAAGAAGAAADAAGPDRPGRLQRLFRGSALSLRKSSSRLAMASSGFSGGGVSRAPSLVMQSPLGSAGSSAAGAGWSRRDASFASLMSLGLGWSRRGPRDLAVATAPVPAARERGRDPGPKPAPRDDDFGDEAAAGGRKVSSANINQEFNHICKQINHLSMSNDAIDV